MNVERMGEDLNVRGAAREGVNDAVRMAVQYGILGGGLLLLAQHKDVRRLLDKIRKAIS